MNKESIIKLLIGAALGIGFWLSIFALASVFP